MTSKKPPRTPKGSAAPRPDSQEPTPASGGSPPHYKWEFRARFRRGAFGWRSQPAMQRVRQAVTEVRKVARRDPLLAAEGAVMFIEKVSPAIEHVDGSSGSMGTTVRNAISSLVEILVAAPADPKVREAWLERLFHAHAEDKMPWIESLTDDWGRLCGTPSLASLWADRLLPDSKRALASTRDNWFFFPGTTACLSALHAAGRYDEIVEMVGPRKFWPYARWAVQARVAQGKKSEALRLAEECRPPHGDSVEIDHMCEEILISSGFVDEAYERYGIRAHRSQTYLAWFRAIAKRYPLKSAATILTDLVADSPGEEGKWFAAAKTAGLYDEAIDLANRAPCSPQTLTRAARDFREKRPAFAVEAGVAALRWLTEGYGYDVSNFDVLSAFEHTMTAAGRAGCAAETLERVQKLVAEGASGAGFVKQVLGARLGQS